MLDARYLDAVSDEVVKLYARLEHDIKLDMARRLTTLSSITDATEYQTEMLRQIGGLKKAVKDLTNKTNSEAEKLMKDIFKGALKTSGEKDLKYFSASKRKLTDNQKQVLTASLQRFQSADKRFLKESSNDLYKKTVLSLKSMTNGLINSSQNVFLQEANNAYFKTVTGAFSYQSAYKTAVDNLCTNGVNAVIYSTSGKPRKYSVESAVRMNLITGIGQASAEQSLNNCETLGDDLVEVSAHMGARETDNPPNPWSNHTEWQGQIYCLNGERDYIDAEGVTHHARNFYECCGYGEVDGICGVNCRHSFYPYLEGTPALFDENDVEKLNSELVSYNGEKMTVYDAEQKLRQCERNIRKYKTQSECQLVIGADNAKSNELVKKWQATAKDLCSQTGIKREYYREYVGARK